MNIKPPMWSLSPSQVSPEWRNFRQNGAVTWLRGLDNVSDKNNQFQKFGTVNEVVTPYGSALEFVDNDSNWLRTESLGSLKYELPHHFAVLVYRDVAQTEVPISLHGGDVSGWRARFDVAGTIQFTYWGGTGGTTAITVPTTSWVLVCASLADTKIRVNIYDLDSGGVQRETLTGTSYVAPDGTNDYIWIGRHGGTTFPFDGRIALAHVGNGWVNDAEFDNLALDPFGPFRQSPRGFEWVERRPTIRVRARGRG
jgi:hypothetical protein